MGPADSVRVSRDRTYSGILRVHLIKFRLRDCHPLWLDFPDHLTTFSAHPCEVPYNPAEETPAVWAVPFSLAATNGIDFSFFSSGYLDVSVHLVRHIHLWIQCISIRESRDQRSFVNSPKLFADFHALHRLLMPRHPPCALISLTTNIHRSQAQPQKQLHYRCAVLIN